MKFIIFFSFLLAALATEGMVYLSLEMSNPAGSSVTFPVPYGNFTDLRDAVSHSGFDIVVSWAYQVPVSQNKIICQALQDPAGPIFLGGPFSMDLSTKISKTETPAVIGFIFCSGYDGFEDHLKKAISEYNKKPAA